ncbi:response regulator [Pseudomonas aeruginosa]|nr:response regulator [Pseudomonas aeruginosa]ELQ8316612.1 response regulator [Pseudomonas aeruginosa]MDY1219341.1 response regulator [Pseudomonas aeruginosa]WIK38034.1 response regulator [Pseudomonas aeruginosa]HBP6379292.1 response regulator [Pseudomonas aeruginosa]HEC1425342.1 response regulator [Pseudomonas aeruginosa]
MKVIILDDSRTDSYLASQVAKNYFDEVEVYGTPAEFHAGLKRGNEPDLMLMDVHIGDLHNGIGELANIKEQYNSTSFIPVIIVTASTEAGLHKLASERGADAVIVKPISKEKLEPILRELLPELQIEGA